MAGPSHRPFFDREPVEYAQPNLNPYLKGHREYGPPVVPAETAATLRGRWQAAFGRRAPLHLEVGPGNGFYLAGMAARHPEQNWLGVELRFKRVVLCARKIGAAGVTNARVARYDAWWLDDLFEDDELAGLHVNFPDPWQRPRDQRKRLMGRYFAEFAARKLQVGGHIRLKSDHLPNLDNLGDALGGLPLRVRQRVADVGRNGTPWPAEDDVVTNYQSKFIKKGLPTHALWVERVAGEAPPFRPAHEVAGPPRPVGSVDGAGGVESAGGAEGAGGAESAGGAD